jgi:hypothetical protein
MRYLRELKALPLDELIRQRYEKFRAMGRFLEGTLPGHSPGSNGYAGQGN